MIRKLKVGEVIREGDFANVNGSEIGSKVPVHSNWHGRKFDPDTFHPIFREIPDEINLSRVSFDITNMKDPIVRYLWRHSGSGYLSKNEVKELGNWLLEVAEFIEEGEQL
jgi:hypothetical protein